MVWWKLKVFFVLILRRGVLWRWPMFKASVLSTKACWFDSPGLHVEVSLGKILIPKLLLMCWPAPCMAATTISVWVYVWITVSIIGPKHLLSALKCKCNNVNAFKKGSDVSCKPRMSSISSYCQEHIYHRNTLTNYDVILELRHSPLVGRHIYRIPIMLLIT